MTKIAKSTPSPIRIAQNPMVTMLSCRKSRWPRATSNQAREEKAKSHAQQRKPSAKTNKENYAYQQDRTKQRRHDVVAHAQRNFRCKGRATGHEDLQRAAIPSLGGDCAKLVYFAHQALAFEGTDGLLIRHDQENAHRAIWRRERLLLLNDRAFRKGLQRRRDQPEGIKRKLELRGAVSPLRSVRASDEADRGFSPVAGPMWSRGRHLAPD